MSELKIFLLLSAVVLFIIVFYRWLLRYLHRNQITVPFSYLFPFEKEVFSGVETIKLDMPNSHSVRIEIYQASNVEHPYIAFNGRINKGVAKVDIDLTLLKNGNYNLKIVLPDQSITRYIRIENQ